MAIGRKNEFQISFRYGSCHERTDKRRIQGILLLPINGYFSILFYKKKKLE